jgi:hypothetical protein
MRLLRAGERHAGVEPALPLQHDGHDPPVADIVETEFLGQPDLAAEDEMRSAVGDVAQLAVDNGRLGEDRPRLFQRAPAMRAAVLAVAG